MIYCYIRTWETHLHSVAQILQLLQEHHLFVKKSEYPVGVLEVEYLDYIVGRDGVKVDPKNI